MTIPQWAFLTNEKRVKRHIPEKSLVLMKFNKEKWVKCFGVPDPRLQISNVGIYSIARPQMGERLVDFIRDLIGDTAQLTITETHGGLGGFTAPLARHFKRVQAVEIEPLHASIISNNTGILAAAAHGDVQVLNADYMDVMHELQQDVILSDPPWGGTDYHQRRAMSLGLNNINIIHIINELYDRGAFKLFVLLVPSNYNFSEFVQRLAPAALANVRISHVDPAKPHHFFIGVKK